MPKSNSVKISVIISTYNRPNALLCVLRSLNDQSSLIFDVVIADDGSTRETEVMLAKFRNESKFEMRHVWQKDDGFRAATIRNKAVAKSKCDYLIFLDGDCAVFPDFISRHVQLAEKDYFVRGSRVMVSEAYTQEFIDTVQAPSSLKVLDLWGLWRSKKIKRIFPLVRLSIGWLRKLKKKKWYGVKTCNLGMWRKDFMVVNGFEEQYIGWGHEDADLAVRLINNHVYRKEGVNAVSVLHLWHSENDRSHLKDNEQRLKDRIQSNITRIPNGVSQY
ncbi:MAG: glycosyltransferase family 2 protein [Gammaproteobacteria bacterium]